MPTDDVILTISSFAGGRDTAVGVIAPSARQALVLWVAEGRIEERRIAMAAWLRLEAEARAGHVPRRLTPGSALVTALFGQRRSVMSTEYVSRFAISRSDAVTISDSLRCLLSRVAVSVGQLAMPFPEAIEPSRATLSQQ